MILRHGAPIGIDYFHGNSSPREKGIDLGKQFQLNADQVWTSLAFAQTLYYT